MFFPANLDKLVKEKIWARSTLLQASFISYKVFGVKGGTYFLNLLGKSCNEADCETWYILRSKNGEIIEHTNSVYDTGKMLNVFPTNTRAKWVEKDLNNDGVSEGILLERGDVSGHTLRLIVKDYKLKDAQTKKFDVGYMYSKNGTQEFDPLIIKDLNKDGVPEIITFIGQDRFGARLFVFNYLNGNITTTHSIESFFHPTYEFVETKYETKIVVKGYNSQTNQKEQLELDIFN